jgi:GNAT superfamily N-acetyltransferase
MDIEVRLAEKRDLDIIHGILDEIQHADMNARARRMGEALDSQFASYMVAVSGGKVIGFLNLWRLPDLVDGSNLGIILDCYVSGEFRRHGVGSMLIGSALELGKRVGINKFYGWMSPQNQAAIALLRKFGFSTETLMLEKR